MREIRRQLFRSELEFVEPRSLEELRNELTRTAREKVDVVVSVGGDGTLNTLIQTLGGTGIPFLVIPAGTANDFARELGIVGRLEKAIRCIRTSEPREIDLIRINGRYMATNGGIGLASTVALSINDLRQRVPGFKSLMGLMSDQVYSASLGTHLLSPRLQRLRLAIDSEERTTELETYLLMINNQPSLGGRFRVAPETSNRDGRFNITAFRHDSRVSFASAAIRIRMMAKSPHSDPNVLTFETSKATIRVLGTPSAVPFFGDGEILARDTRFEIEICPKALRVYQPERRRKARNEGAG
jgi:YegS/Rv2252/BmrU family lipid kinase